MKTCKAGVGVNHCTAISHGAEAQPEPTENPDEPGNQSQASHRGQRQQARHLQNRRELHQRRRPTLPERMPGMFLGHPFDVFALLA